MPRSSSSSRSSSRTFSTSPAKSSFRQVKATPPVATFPKSTPPSMPPMVQVQPPGFLQSMKEGFGLGIGASIARNIVDRAFGAGTAALAPAPAPTAPAPIPVSSVHTLPTHSTKSLEQREYEQCIKEHGTEDACKQYRSVLEQT